MSGRSGYVRAKQQLRDTKRAGSVQESTNFAATVPPTSYASSFSHASESGSTSAPGTIPASGYVSAAALNYDAFSFDSQHPNFERSKIRVKMDETSEAIRDGLSNFFTLGKKSGNSGKTSEAGSEHHSCVLSEENSGPKKILWLGNRTLTSPTDGFFTEKHMWLDDGDTLIFLTEEDENGNFTGAPSFRVHSEALTKCMSTVWLTLLDECAKSQAEVEDIALMIHRHRDGLPHQFNDMMNREANKMFNGVKYMISYAPPRGVDRPSLYRWRDTMRNAMAIVHEMPGVVGTSYYGMFKNVYEFFLDWFEEKNDPARLVFGYIKKYNYHDVRLNPSAAVGLLALSEEHKWEAGYREGFVHCVGMYRNLRKVVDDEADGGAMSQLKPITRRLLSDHALEMQSRILVCAERLKNFDLRDMWPMRIGDNIEAKDAFDDSGPFFLWFYSQNGTCAPDDQDENLWLKPGIVTRLQRDFGAIYDDLVDRSAKFQCTEAGWTIVRPSSNMTTVGIEEIQMSRILRDFDERNGYIPIPHPFPNLPASLLPAPAGHSVQQPEGSKPKGLLGLLKKKKKAPMSQPAGDIGEATKTKFQLAFTRASNSQLLGADYPGNDLAEAFLHHEQTTEVGRVDPRIVRQGRWVFIYGVLQTLASVSESVPGLLFPVDNLDYFTCTSLQGCPHWKQEPFESSKMTSSYCWKVVETW